MALQTHKVVFFVNIRSNRKNNGTWVSLVFSLVQNSRDIFLFERIKAFLGCGNIFKDKSAVKFRVDKFSSIEEKVLPFFKDYLLQTNKSRDFVDFCKIYDLIKNKANLTQEGLQKIINIKISINTGRKY